MDRILVVADDRALCDSISACVAPAGFATEAVHDFDAGVTSARSGWYALIVVALRLPNVHASFEFLRCLRVEIDTPIIMFAPRLEEVDRILGLEMGADDCLSTPFNPRELLARIHAILRRVRGVSAAMSCARRPPLFVVGDIHLDPGRRVVLRAGKVIPLTAAEFELLAVLVRNAGQVVRRERLALPVLGRVLSGRDRSIDTHVSRLRKKLGQERTGVDRIKTIRNVGYLYVVHAADVSPGLGDGGSGETVAARTGYDGSIDRAVPGI